MDTFIKRFQPERYDKWKLGEDIGPHPEELNKPSPIKYVDIFCCILP